MCTCMHVAPSAHLPIRSWAFASVAMGEAASYINTGNIISLSEKQLVDCDASNGGCEGGWVSSMCGPGAVFPEPRHGSLQRCAMPSQLLLT